MTQYYVSLTKYFLRVVLAFLLPTGSPCLCRSSFLSMQLNVNELEQIFGKSRERKTFSLSPLARRKGQSISLYRFSAPNCIRTHGMSLLKHSFSLLVSRPFSFRARYFWKSCRCVEPADARMVARERSEHKSLCCLLASSADANKSVELFGVGKIMIGDL